MVAGGARHVAAIPEMIEWGSLPADGVMSRLFYQLSALMECQSNSGNVVVDGKKQVPVRVARRSEWPFCNRCLSPTPLVRGCLAHNGGFR